MKLYKYILMLTAAVVMTGCYEQFGEVAPAAVYESQEAFEKAFPNCSYKTIRELKDIYAARTGDAGFEGGENSGWDDTKYYQFGSNSETYGEEDYYICGKVISNDEEGNIYKSLYLLDETGAIEVRLTSGNYLKYYMGEWDGTYPIEIPSSYVYVRVKDLFIGNYRMMLSIGAGPTDSFNKRDEHKFYANSAIDSPKTIAEHVFVGGNTVLRGGEDIPVVDETNYTSLNGKGGMNMLGRLILFRNISCMYAGVADHLGRTGKPVGDDNIYPSWLYTENMNYSNGILSKPWYNWAYSVNSKCLYGSVLFTYLSDVPSSGIVAGAYSLRTSGYSRFAGGPTLKNGAKGDLLAIYSIYSKSWTYNYGAYQLAASRRSDIMFDDEDYLTTEQVKAMTPDGGDGTYRILSDDDSRYIAYDVENDKVVGVERNAENESVTVLPTFLTRYVDAGTDKLVNYPSYAAMRSALLFGVNDGTEGAVTVYHILKVGYGNEVTTETVTLSENSVDYNPAYEFVLEPLNTPFNHYAIRHGDKYLGLDGGSLALVDAPYMWRITISNYDREKSSYYVPWVGEEDDESGGGMD